MTGSTHTHTHTPVEHEQAAPVLGLLEALLGKIKLKAAHGRLPKLLPLQLRADLRRNVARNLQTLPRV